MANEFIIRKGFKSLQDSQITGSLNLSGDLEVLGSISGDITGSASTASYIELSNVDGSASLASRIFTNSSSIASLETVSGSYANSASFASDISTNSASIASLETVSGSYANSASFASSISANSSSIKSLNAVSSSYLLNTTDTLTGDLTVTGNIIATTLNVQDVTASVVYSSGSNIFGSSSIDTQQFTGSIKVSGSVELEDNVKLNIGTGDDLQIYHDGSNSYINESGTGVLSIQSDGTEVQINKGASEYMGRFIADAGVKLYYDNSSKFETTSGGISVTGNIYATGTSNSLVVISRDNMFVDAGQFYLGADNGSTDNTFRQQVSNGSYFINTRKSGTWTNRLQIDSAGTLIVSQGATFAGDVYATDYYMNDYIYHNGDTNTYIRAQADQWTFRTGGDDRMHIDNTGVGIFTTSPQRTLDVRGTGLSIFGTGGNTELMLRGQVEGTGTVRNVGAWHWSVRGDVGGNNDDLTLLRFQTGSYQGTAMQIRTDNGGIAIGLNNTGYSSQILSVKSGTSDNVFYGESSDANCFASFRDNSSTANIEFGVIGDNHVLRKDTTQYFVVDNIGDVYNFQSVSNANTSYGYRAGRYAATGGSNSFFGYTTGQSLTSGANNSGFGRSALKSVTTGGNNVGIGIEALQDLTVGGQNVAIGRAAGTLGDFSETVFVGALAGYQNTQGTIVGIGNESLKNNTGIQNTAVGHRTLINNTSGARNTAVGFRSLDTNVSGNDNTAFGNEALRNSTGTRNTAVGDRALLDNTDGAYNTAVGMAALKAVTSGTFNVGIGYDAYQAVTTTSYNTGVGTSTGTYQTGNYNTSVGYNSNFGVNGQSAGSYNTMVGYWAGKENQGENNTCLGAIAGRFMQGGARNTIVGSQAADNQNITGNDNSVLGFAAGQNITSGYSNTFIGGNAGRLIQNAFENTYIGYHSGYNASGGNYNTGLGVYALREATSADRCTAIGRSALISNTTGDFNTALGMSAGEANVGGSNNVFLGYNAGTSHISGGNVIIIGSGAQSSSTSASNQITLGNANIGTLRCNVTSITSLSDKRDKTNIKDSDYGLNVIDSLRPVTFDWNHRDESENKGKKDIGFIAQELQEIDDDSLRLVYSDNPEKLEATYGRLIPVLVKAIQELKADNNSLKARIETLENN